MRAQFERYNQKSEWETEIIDTANLENDNSNKRDDSHTVPLAVFKYPITSY